jgi:hypothetical protein
MKLLFILIASLLITDTASATTAAELHVYTHVSVAFAATVVSYGVWKMLMKPNRGEPEDKSEPLIAAALTVIAACAIKESMDLNPSRRDMAAGAIGIGAASLTIFTFGF